MAVTPEQLAAALRVGDSVEETAEVERLLSYATEAVTRYAPNAPEASSNEAVIRLASYLFDQPTSTRGDHYAAAGRNSGAWAILMPYRIRRAGSIGEAVQAARASGAPGNPVTDVQVSGTTLTVSYADGTTRTATLPSGGGDGTDQTARDSAAQALAAAQAAQSAADGKITGADTSRLIAAHTTDANAHHVPATGGGGAVLSGGHTFSAGITADTWTATTIAPSATATLVAVQWQNLATASADDWAVNIFDGARLRAGKVGRCNVRVGNSTRVYLIRLTGGSLKVSGPAAQASEGLILKAWSL